MLWALLLCVFLPRWSFRFRVLEDADEGELPVEIRVVEPIPDDEFVGTLEANEIRINFRHPPRLLVEQDAKLYPPRAPLLQTSPRERERAARIQDVVNDQHISSFYWVGDIAHDLKSPGTFRPGAITGELHEVDLRAGPCTMECTDEIRREHETTLQDGHDKNVRTILSADIACDLFYPRCNLRLTEQRGDDACRWSHRA